ncbi:hypothetical protein C0033_07315 [Clostridium sp. chh4-2]|uniref:hypothetical protein n=1 Tax=Clostridium sp. chh4-2 TaxID=2067550 RepID=UPI000CCF662B|nr:hypothetical protein [Clostridium sp. chh4-2]PNV62817.1 hypothetical protein C0033_07315 [Clostridium sp. chh4-2]
MICNNTGIYLYELIEDYKEAGTLEEKAEIFKLFCSSIWSCDNKRRIYTKTIHFTIRNDLLETDLGRLFSSWSSIEYNYYKSVTETENWYDLIRQKINNIYTRYFDSDVILGKEYMDLLKTPKNLYYEWISGTGLSRDGANALINEAMDKAQKMKEKLQRQKMSLPWNEYKSLMETFLLKILDNCKLIGDYETKTSVPTRLDFLTEDHFYVKYINCCLDGEIRKWQKKYYGLPQNTRKQYGRCMDCGCLYIQKARNQKRCGECQHRYNRKNKTAKQKLYRVEKLKIPAGP